MELILARILPKLKTATNLKVVLLSATLEFEDFVERATDTGLDKRFIETLNIEGRHMTLTNVCLPNEISETTHNLELAIRTVNTLHRQYRPGYPNDKVVSDGTIFGFCPGKPEIKIVVDMIKGAMRRGLLRSVSETPTPTRLEESTAVHLQFVQQYAPHLYRWTFLASKP